MSSPRCQVGCVEGEGVTRVIAPLSGGVRGGSWSDGAGRHADLPLSPRGSGARGADGFASLASLRLRRLSPLLRGVRQGDYTHTRNVAMHTPLGDYTHTRNVAIHTPLGDYTHARSGYTHTTR